MSNLESKKVTTSNPPKKLEIKTSGEIFEDVFIDDTLNNKNKQWISKESLIMYLIKRDCKIDRKNCLRCDLLEELK